MYNSKKVAIIGAGPAGCMSACQLDGFCDVTLFDKSLPLKTLLATGGGRCNLAHAEYNFKDLAKNYPRGEKFLYSVFSRFSTQDTLDFFEKIGVKTYTQENGRIFPISNDAKEVREKILNQLHQCKFIKEEVLKIKKINNGFDIKTNNANYLFDIIIYATGGKNGYTPLLETGHTIISPNPSLVGLQTNPNYSELQGVTIKNCVITENKKEYTGDILFTQNGITGPAIFELSSINARKEFPYKIKINFKPDCNNLQEMFDKNPHKELKNILSEILPKSVIQAFLGNIDTHQKGYEINSNTKELVRKIIQEHEFEIIGTRINGETVTSGGVSLKEIESSSMESKLVENLYFCGEILDIDGFCGGYNLQNCWSTGKIAGESVLKKIDKSKDL